jgi:hypothetical protein
VASDRWLQSGTALGADASLDRQRLTTDHCLYRDVAQPGSALAWGARGRQFKSGRPDQNYSG